MDHRIDEKKDIQFRVRPITNGWLVLSQEGHLYFPDEKALLAYIEELVKS